jgi:hypothetical protein
MKYILVRQGGNRASAFSDIVEQVNYQDVPQVGFYTQVAPSMRLIRNRTTDNHDSPFAIARFHVDPALKVQPPSHFRRIDMRAVERMMTNHKYVIYGVVNPTHHVIDHTVLDGAVYVARDADGKLINAQTGDVLGDSKVTFMTVFFAFVRVKGLPIYLMVLNPNLLSATDGFDCYHEETDTKWIMLPERDNALIERVFTPQIYDGTLIGNVIVRDEGDGQPMIQLFNDPCGILYDEKHLRSDVFINGVATIDTNLSVFTMDGAVRISSQGRGYVRIVFDLGDYFNLSRTEHPALEYVVL